MPVGAERVYELTKRVVKIPLERREHKEKAVPVGRPGTLPIKRMVGMQGS